MTKHAIFTKNWRRSQERDGLCLDCIRPAEPRRRQCARHLKENARRSRTARKNRVARGVCSVCTAPVAPGRSKCRPHLDVSASYVAARRRDDATCVIAGCAAKSLPGSALCSSHRDARKPAVHVKRCRCGLTLPCYSCIPTARQMAEARRAGE